jgi:hypothetical protein
MDYHKQFLILSVGQIYKKMKMNKVNKLTVLLAELVDDNFGRVVFKDDKFFTLVLSKTDINNRNGLLVLVTQWALRIRVFSWRLLSHIKFNLFLTFIMLG